MVGGTWFTVPRPWSCGSTLGISLERSFIQIAANGWLEPKVQDAAEGSKDRNTCIALPEPNLVKRDPLRDNRFSAYFC